MPCDPHARCDIDFGDILDEAAPFGEEDGTRISDDCIGERHSYYPHVY